ncbi:hypothetical protein ACEWY4_006869 [Coilia grayii]|uniref:Matrin-type domain-containing protein n=1 Tax=Coilia grayii TaxID=363190 RepID=A0ABD1KEV0_9TELE
MYRPQGPDFNRPRHLMPMAVNQESHTIFSDYQRSTFPPALPEEPEVSVYQRNNASSRRDATQGMSFPPRPSRDMDKTGFEDWSQYNTPSSQQVACLPAIQQFTEIPSSTVMAQSSTSWNSSRSVEDELLPDSVNKVLASFGLTREDLELLSQFPDSELTPERLPSILENLKGQKACRVSPMSSPHSQVSMLPTHRSPNLDPTPATAIHPASYLSIATQVPGKVIEYGHASQERFKRVPLPPPPTKCKAEPAVNSKDARNFLNDPRRPRSRSRDRPSHSPPSGNILTSSTDWHNHSNSAGHTAGSKDLRNKYTDWKSQSHCTSRDHSSSPSRSGRHSHHSPSRSASHSQSSCSSPGRSPARHGRGPASRSERWRSPQRRSPYKHTHSQGTPPHHSQLLPSHPGRRGSPSPSGRRSHPRNSSSHIPTGEVPSRQFPHERSRLPNKVTHKRSAGYPLSSSPSSSLSSSSSRNSKRHSSPSLGCGKGKASERQATSHSSSSQGRSTYGRSSHGRLTASASAKTDPPQSTLPGSQSAKSKAKSDAADRKPLVELVKGKQTDTGDAETTDKIKWATDERGIVLISGLPESGCAESEIVKLAAPYGVPTEVIIAAAECKALVVLPDRSSAEDMVKSPTSISSCELSMEQLSVSVDITRPVTLFHAMMGPDRPCGALTAWNRLLVVHNVPGTPNGPKEVQQLIQRFGNISRSLVLNHNKIIFEMETAAIAQVVYKRFQKFPCIVQNNPLSFSMKPDATGVMKVQEAKSEPSSTSTSSDSHATDVAACLDIPPAATERQEASSSEAMETKQSGRPTTLPGPAKHPARCPAGKDAPVSQKTAVLNGDGETADRGSTGNNVAPRATFDIPNVNPALLQALLRECKSRAAMKTASEPKGHDKEVLPEAPPAEKPPEKPTSRGVTQDKDPEMEDNMEDDLACNMDDFVTVDEVGDFAEEPSLPPEETVGTAEGHSIALGHSSEKTDPCSEKTDPCSENTDSCSEDTLVSRAVQEEIKSRTCEVVTTDVNMLEDKVQEYIQEKMESENCTDGADMNSQEDEIEKVTHPGLMDLKDSEQDGGHKDGQAASGVTGDEVGTVAGKEGEGNSKEDTATTTTTSPAPKVTGALGVPKRRRTQNGAEVETKRIRKEPIFPKDYSLAPFDPAHPVGMEFLESRTGFFCQVCAKFYCGDEEAKRSHCRTLKHYENLEISLQHWKMRHNTGPNGTAL